METFGNQLLAGSTLADDQHGPVERRGTARALNGVEEREALADELVCAFHDPAEIWLSVGGKSHHLARIFALLSTGNECFSSKSAVFQNMARSLYSNGQV